MNMSRYRQDIQGLRAIAVLAVIIFHFNPAWLPGGFVGVDIFLVISGFLISSILLHKKAKPDYQLLQTLGYFYSSRIKRIVPAYFTMLIIVTVIAAVLFLPTDFATYRDGLKKAAYFNSNSYFASFGDYFAPANYEQPLLHTWSLAIEIQFYLLAPFIFLLLPKRFLGWVLPLSILCFTAYAEYQLRILGNEQATYYSFVARLPAFLLGAWAALLIDKSNIFMWVERQKLSVTWFAVSLLGFALVLPKFTGHFPGIAGLLPTIGAALIILLNANNRISQLLSGRFIVWVGALSYSLYLWHWPVLAFMRYYTGSEILSWQYGLAFIAITLSLAAASFYWIETPLRLKRSKKRNLAYFSLAAVVVLSVVGMKKINAYYTPEKLPVEYTRYAAPNTICHGKIIGDCLKGDLTSYKEVLVLGDSHAGMLNDFFDYLGKELGFKARIITASSCVTIPGFDYQRIAEWAHEPCLRQIEEASRYFEKNNIIFIAALWSTHMQSQKFKNSLDDFLSNGKGKQLYLISQEPRLRRNPLRQVRFSELGLMSKTEYDPIYQWANIYLESIAKSYNNVRFISYKDTDIFTSAPMYRGKLTYFDSHHLNQIGAVEYAKVMLSYFTKIIGND